MRIALLVVALMAVLGVSVASAASPFDQLSAPVGNPGVPECLSAAANTGAPRVCKLRPFASPNWQADLSEWVVVRTAWAHESSCAALAAIVPSFTLDGNSIPVTQSACEFNSNLDVWQVDFRAVRPPLAAGDHAITTSFFFPQDVIGGPAGTTSTFSTTLTVS